MHSSLDDQLASVSKSVLLGVKGDAMVESEDPLTDQLILSARDGTVNPIDDDEDADLYERGSRMSRSKDGNNNDARVENLVKALRGVCQERVDEGTASYNELFDLLSEDVLDGLHALGITKGERYWDVGLSAGRARRSARVVRCSHPQGQPPRHIRIGHALRCELTLTTKLTQLPQQQPTQSQQLAPMPPHYSTSSPPATEP